MMKIVEFFESDAPMQQTLLQELRRCDWSAGKFLLHLLKEDAFAKTLVGPGKLFFLLEGKTVVAFLTLTTQDSRRRRADLPQREKAPSPRQRQNRKIPGVTLWGAPALAA